MIYLLFVTLATLVLLRQAERELETNHKQTSRELHLVKRLNKLDVYKGK